jgi:hypothetical protein
VLEPTQQFYWRPALRDERAATKTAALAGRKDPSTARAQAGEPIAAVRRPKRLGMITTNAFRSAWIIVAALLLGLALLSTVSGPSEAPSTDDLARNSTRTPQDSAMSGRY